ncbi:alcohol dehydrogenase catalytic domain-containing protein [Actinomadura verrucosospora]|uniref:Zn-dependent alcohol dehydrogenase n=1 Tax=Actinomadura verrucosospora TaxID=46165 RepID=A0A7D4AVY1_ACTVE|nr:alcohol dehydrogenase catalytic domain-containing protein [Actinomadura verrucosospora]QKG27068.1 Zn-dependent alcohol dehydrogenase [Actinomadura verrucosospora]
MTDMLAVRVREGSLDLHLENVPVPVLGPRDVLVRVASAGLAPSIVKHLARGRFTHLPSTPGHEVAGTVVDAGPDAARSPVGTRVRVHPMLSCGSCRYCTTARQQMCAQAAMIGNAAFGTGPMELYARYHDGGLAEFIRVPEWLVDPLPDRVGFDVAAKLHELGNAHRALSEARLPEGGRVVVTAATGAMGTATVKLAESFRVGELVLVGRSAERLEAVRPLAGPVPVRTVALEELGPDWARTEELTGRLRELLSDGADAVLDYLPGGPGTAQAMQALATGGALVHMGGSGDPLPFPIRVIMTRCWRVVGTRGCTREDTAAVLGLLAGGRLDADELITHRFALRDAAEAMAAVLRRAEPMWMAVVNP